MKLIIYSVFFVFGLLFVPCYTVADQHQEDAYDICHPRQGDGVDRQLHLEHSSSFLVGRSEANT